MVSDSRSRMVAGAAQLLAEKGLGGTSFAEVLELTRAPRGSVYHHFPHGKDQLIAEAVEWAGDRALERLAEEPGHDAEDVTSYFLSIWRRVLERSSCGAGCAVLAVAVSTDSLDLLDRAAAVFRSWTASLAQLLETGGLDADQARRFSTVLVAAAEGAVVMSRAQRSIDVFDVIAEHMVEQARILAQ
jgi:TetR/AcrR family transcriptional regulator, lmrAB and yxaGH operons repressor